MRMTITSALAGALLSTLAVGAEPLPAPFATCVLMKRDSERLACYDQAVAILQGGSESVAAPSAENMFGANGDIGQVSDAHRGAKREELKQISAQVTSLHRLDDGMIVLELDNGQVWRQQDSDVSLTVGSGDKVTIARATLGTFRITDKRGRAARFRRVR
jgi:hypothetical protein